MNPASVNRSVSERARRVRLVIFDVDGVLTDGRVYAGDDGVNAKAFSIRDGQGLVMLRECGIAFGVISGRSSAAVDARMQELGAVFVHQGVRDKLPVFARVLAELDLNADEVAYVGDDLPDLPVMLRAGLAVAVGDAHALVLEHAHWCTASAGGCGAAREICEMILQAQERLDELYLKYLA